ncbi:CopG family transcriptional regulator [Candidatus Bathyarchaeota archaeon]|nr:MAG: CopG family transcriptional regulator [Candidatus Bathyarchaeota archaeon]
MKLITLYLPESYLRALDELVEKRYYPSRAEAIRAAIRDLLNKEFWGRAELEGEARRDEAKSKAIS